MTKGSLHRCQSEHASFQKYIKNFEGVNGLLQKEENYLLRKAQGGDTVARDKLFHHNAKFVVAIALKFENLGLPLMDVINEGNIGMLKSIETFDVARTHKLVTYSVWWVRAYIIRALVERGRLIRIPAQSSGRLSKNMRAFQFDPGKLDQEDQEVFRVNNFASMEIVEETLPDPKSISDLDKDRLRDGILGLLTCLSPIQLKIILGYFGLGASANSATLATLGEELGLSRERVRQIKKDALTLARKHSTLSGYNYLRDSYE